MSTKMSGTTLLQMVVTTQSLLITILGSMFFVLSYSSFSSASFRLRKEYWLFNEKLGQTGIGLKFEDIKEGSTLSNLISLFLFSVMAYANDSSFLEQLEQEFPFWKCPYGFWWMLIGLKFEYP